MNASYSNLESTGAPRRISLVNIDSLIFLFLFSLGNIFVTLVVESKFRQIFADALPGKPLPSLTNFVLDYPFWIVGADCAVAILGLLALINGTKMWHSFFAINFFSLLQFFQFGITVVALYMPMTTGITGMR